MRAHKDIAAASPVREPLDADVVALAADVLRQLGDATRFHLLGLLAEGQQDVTTLTARVAASRSSVSQHLGRLRLAGLVGARREGRRMVYRLTSDHVRRLVEETYAFAEHVGHRIPHHDSE
ncbi:ArsR/SmtB family transcription factor [Pseudonocardia halophobica]|uniref:ArsR/SmtB family transcription factor n=1 Tax=Pseudonocardia halophobica TaxID=29401 RepID=UPI003D8EF3FF